MRDPAVITPILFFVGLVVLSVVYAVLSYLSSYTLLPATTINLRNGKIRKYWPMVAPKYLMEENKRLKLLLEEKNKQLKDMADRRVKRESNRQMTFLPGISNKSGKPIVPYTTNGKTFNLIFKNQQYFDRFNSPDWVWVAREVPVGRRGSKWECSFVRVPDKDPADSDPPLDAEYYDHRYDEKIINQIPPTFYDRNKRKWEYIEDQWLPFSWDVEEVPEGEPEHHFSASNYMEYRKKALKNGKN